ncbi:MAG TPA: tetraacyldisaccharide 4'-kinase [Syntrophales bacterium]|nr:tetraacyldisaccharide 4'-kinase [Syntrophales bacterium]
MSRYLQRLWYENARLVIRVLRFLLLLLSMPYAAGIRLINFLYDRGLLETKSVSCPVLSVGNLVVGGTGKTPVVILIARILRDAGYKPAVLSRGYKGKSQKAVNVVSDGRTLLMGIEDAGDEPVLTSRSLPGIPVLTGPERYRTAQHAIEHFGCDVLVLDDGFQHRALLRNLDIVLMDDERPFGNGFLLPRGPLREPLGALKRAHLFILTRPDRNTIVNPRSLLGTSFPEIPVFWAHRRPKAVLRGKNIDVHPPEFLAGKKILAFAGIANPASFEKTMRVLGAEPLDVAVFPDHHVYTDSDIKKLESRADGVSADMILTTEKDAVKLEQFSRFYEKVHVLSVEMEITAPEGVFAEWLLNQLKS